MVGDAACVCRHKVKVLLGRRQAASLTNNKLYIVYCVTLTWGAAIFALVDAMDKPLIPQQCMHVKAGIQLLEHRHKVKALLGCMCRQAASLTNNKLYCCILCDLSLRAAIFTLVAAIDKPLIPQQCMHVKAGIQLVSSCSDVAFQW